MEEECREQRRFESIEKEVSEIKVKLAKHAEEITSIKESQAETRIYIKQIFERINDLKVLFNSTTNSANDKWVKIILELIKAIGIIAGIIAGIKIFGA